MERFLLFCVRHLVEMYRHLLHRWQLLLHIHRVTIRSLHVRSPPSNPLRTALYETRQKPCFFVLARCPRATSGSYNVVTARHARCTHTYATVPCIRFTGHGVITLRARSTTTSHSVGVTAIFGPVALSTSLSVIYYSPVIDQCESPWHPCKTRSRNMDALIATMTNYFTIKRSLLTLTARMFVPG